MFCLNLDTTDPYFNLAAEEFLLKKSTFEFLLLYVNDSSVIIGKHQSGHREVNTKFVNENHIPVIRRISGGGTVFHDRGNLNFSFIRHSETGKQVDFIKYTRPVIDFLKSMNVEAKFEGKNDLKVNGIKISGNAEHIHGNRVLHHGTLLFDTSMKMLSNTLRKNPICYNSKAIPSNPVPVMNLNELIVCFGSLDDLRADMMNYFLKYFNDAVPYQLSTEEKTCAESLAESKYRTWEWNWAYGPQYNFINSFELNNTLHTCNLLVKEGIITECAIEGSEMMQRASKIIPGCRHMVRDLLDTFRKENIFLTESDIFNFF